MSALFNRFFLNKFIIGCKGFPAHQGLKFYSIMPE